MVRIGSLIRNVSASNSSVVLAALLYSIFNTSVLIVLNRSSIGKICSYYSKPLTSGGGKETYNDKYDLVSQSEFEGRYFEMRKSGEEKYRIDFEGFFNWQEEFERLLTVLPVLKYSTNYNENYNNSGTFRILYKKGIRWEKLKPPAEILGKIPRKLKSSEIRERFLQNIEIENLLGKKILNCREISKLEKSRDYPAIKYMSRSISRWRGRLEISENHTISIVQKRFTNDDKGSKFVGGYEGENGEFELAKREVLNLMRATGWYGMPTLYGLCITNEKYHDITHEIWDDKNPELKPFFMRYIVSNLDESNSLPFCFGDSPLEECVKLRKIFYRIRSSIQPPVAALTVMFNIAKLFQNLFEQRAYMDGIPNHEIMMTSDFDVSINDVSSLIILPKDNNNLLADYTRLLSGTICKRGLDCPSPTWYKTNFGNSVAASCSEIRGSCSNVGLCYGVDVQSYVCVFSRWVFGTLQDLVPHSWPLKFNLTQLISQATEPNPEKRCTWNELKYGFQSLLQNAKLTWPEEDSDE